LSLEQLESLFDSPVGVYAAGFGIALFASFALTYLVRTFALRFSWVVAPRADRWHKRPTALYGGVAIYLAMVLGALAVNGLNAPGAKLLLACSTGMFGLGLVDDIARLKPQTKLVGQIAVATAFTTFGMRLHWLDSPPLDQALTIFWMVGITNALNLLDNIDGAAAGVALVAAIFTIYFGHSGGHGAVAVLAAAFAGSLLGFLLFNFNPASIFMGDCGSLFIGFFLAGIGMLDNQEASGRKLLGPLLVPILLLLVPILDTALVTVTRKFHGRSIVQGGRDHTSHRLVALGLSERAAASALWALSAVSGLVAVAVNTSSQAIAALLVPVFGVSLLLLYILMGKVKVYGPVGDSPSPRAMLPTLHGFVYKRRVLEVLCDAALIVAAFYGSYLLRFEGSIVEPFYGQMLRCLPIVVVVQLGSFLILGMYRVVWRYTSIRDLASFVRALLGAWVASVVALAFVYRLKDISRSALLIDAILLLVTVGSTRILFRWFQSILVQVERHSLPQGKRALIYGAGDGGELLARQLMSSPLLGYAPVGFLDDDPHKHGRKIHGLPVLGPVERLGDLLIEGADCVVVSTEKLSAAARVKLDEICGARGVVPLRARVVIDESTQLEQSTTSESD
jgi:UDP-GlcNAc:undecaprenyl-phosphate GlcNAc-1-phosphate transferase